MPSIVGGRRAGTRGRCKECYCAGALLIETEQLVGREPRVSAVSKTSEPVPAFSDEEVINRASSPFVKEAVGEIEDWIESLSPPNVELRLGRKTGRAIHLNGKRTARFLRKGMDLLVAAPILCSGSGRTEGTIELARAGHGRVAKEGFIRLHLRTPEDLEVYKKVIHRRLTMVT